MSNTASTNIPPGLYIIVNAKTKTVVDLYNGGSSSGTAINGWSSSYKKGNPHQEWQIADVGNGQYIIINNGTGTLLSANDGGQAAVTGQAVPPSQASARWTAEATLFKSDNTVIFRNVQYTNSILDLSGGQSGNGTPVLAYPQNSPISDNQTWTLIHI